MLVSRGSLVQLVGAQIDLSLQARDAPLKNLVLLDKVLVLHLYNLKFLPELLDLCFTVFLDVLHFRVFLLESPVVRLVGRLELAFLIGLSFQTRILLRQLRDLCDLRIHL